MITAAALFLLACLFGSIFLFKFVPAAIDVILGFMGEYSLPGQWKREPRWIGFFLLVNVVWWGALLFLIVGTAVEVIL